MKVCGMREPENISQVLALPLDYMGFVFYEKSPRFADSPGLESWVHKNDHLFASVKKVGVFVNAEIERVLNIVHDYQLDYVQLHGNESPEYCSELKQYWSISTLHPAKIIKAFAVDEHFDFEETRQYEGWCAYFLFDTKTPEHGGSGKTFDWSLLQQYSGITPFFLSGGIGVEAAESIRQLKIPALYGVDVNSRFETAPGVKDVEKLKEFMAQFGGTVDSLPRDIGGGR